MGLRAVIDLEQLGYQYETPQLGLEVDYSEGVEAFIDTFLNVAQDLVPVRTGNLLNSIEADGDEMGAEVWTDCEYSQYVEYGTQKMPAQPYFRPALEAALNEAEMYWNDAWQEALEEEQEMLEEMEEDGKGGNGGAAIMAGGGGGLLGLIIASIIVGILQGLINGIKELLFGDESAWSRRGGGLISMVDIEIY